MSGATMKIKITDKKDHYYGRTGELKKTFVGGLKSAPRPLLVVRIDGGSYIYEPHQYKKIEGGDTG